MKSYQSPLLNEIEGVVITNLNQITTDPLKRQEALIRVLAATQIQLFFEKAYFAIFGSQLSLLQFLNSAPSTSASPADVMPIYERAKSKETDFYRNYDFDKWVGFLQWQLLVKKEGERIVLTVRGREFLKYLIDQGYSFNKGG